MRNLYVVESRGQRVLTSAQIADCYGTTVDCIKQNFHTNRDRFVEGKHYIVLTGGELKAFKNEVRIPYQDEKQEENEVRIPHSAEIKAKYQFDTQFKYAKVLYLWTEKGALLHAKSLNTDKAWQVYDYLVDFYFRAKEEAKPQVKAPVVPTVPVSPPVMKVPTETFPEIENPIRVFRELMEMAECRGIKVQSAPLKGYKSMLRDDKIAIKNTLSMNQIIFELAYELSHAVLHEKEGKLTDKVEWEAYHMRAWRAAIMLIEALTIKVA